MAGPTRPPPSDPEMPTEAPIALTRLASPSRSDTESAQEQTLQLVRKARIPGFRAGAAGPPPPPLELSRGGYDKYDRLGEIARGGMGVVYRALDRDIHREVAMKVLLEPDAIGRTGLVRFLAEAQATGQLEHPNIVPVHEVGLDDQGQLYFTMKYVRGSSLKRVIDRLRAAEPDAVAEFTLSRLLGIFMQVCQGVSFAHSRRVVHRDLKPANIMLGEFGEVQVMDWGLAHVLGQPEADPADRRAVVGIVPTTDEGEVAGSPQFMSPEQAQGLTKEIDERSDVYSLGVILYTMLALKLPFQRGASSEVLGEVIAGRLLPLEVAPLFGSVPPEVPAIALKAMSRLPANRYASAGLLADDVQRFLDGRSVSARPDGWARRASKWARRHRAVSLSITGALAAIVLTWRGTLAYQRYRAASEREQQIAAHLQAAEADESHALYSRVGKTTGDDYASALQLADVREKLDRASRNLLAAASEYREALRLDPEAAGVRDYLADAYLRLWKLAYYQKDEQLMSSYAEEVRSYSGASFESRYGPLLRGDGSVELTVAGADADAWLFRFVQDDAQYGREVPVPVVAGSKQPAPGEVGYAALDAIHHQPPGAATDGPFPGSTYRFSLSDVNRLGAGPARRFERRPLEPGSYLLVVQSAGHEPLRLPFLLDRDDTGAGRKVQLEVAPLPLRQRVPGFTYVPRTEALLGGGGAAGALFASPHRETIGPFFIQTREVSVSDYRAFLTDLVAHGQQAEARERLPKSFDAAGAGERMKVRKHAVELADVDWARRTEAELAEEPISGVSWLDASAYVVWKAAHDGRPYRLPTDEEWEVAARGADGRTYSWGEIYRPEAARLTQGYGMISAAQLEELRTAHSSFDESVFGVRDLAGSVAEWVGSDFIAGSPQFKSIRGNAWGLTPQGLRCAFRATGSSQHYFHSTIGLRMALDAPAQK